MNHIRKFLGCLGGLLIVLVMPGCEKNLIQVAQTTITDGAFWKTTGDLATGCNYLYTFLPGLSDATDPSGTPTPLHDNYSDIAAPIAGSLNTVSNGSRTTAPATSVEWTNFYKLIRAANNILDKAGRIEGDPAIVNRYRGEARFFRAFGYFELIKRFGDVPLILKTLTAEDPDLFGPRTSSEVVIDSIYADLDFAAGHLPQPDLLSSASGNEYGRITRSAALAFKSRVALFEGTRQKFLGIGNPSKHLQAAIDAGKAVISEDKHRLFYYPAKEDSSFFYLFQNAGETYAANKENILVRLYGQDIANVISFHGYIRQVLDLGSGLLTATRAYAHLVLFKDGLPVGKSVYDSTGRETSSLTEFRNRDPRFGMTIFRKGDETGNTFQPQYVATPYYRLKKYHTSADWLPNRSFVDLIVIRYSEVLLNYAEALFEMTDGISDDDLDKTINLIRSRATNNRPDLLPPLTNAFVSSNGLDMRTELRRERTVELAFEGFRYWDLLRWKAAEKELPKALIGARIFPNEYATGTALPAMQDGYTLLEAADKRTFNVGRDYLWPLPVNELGLNPNLGTNNPGW